uniref:Uncharacterized protein n=1 Tax=Arundo donax TaxID=35708 RepID=A0A0A9E2G4_ARUDO
MNCVPILWVLQVYNYLHAYCSNVYWTTGRVRQLLLRQIFSSFWRRLT